jgi:hypothetical protein
MESPIYWISSGQNTYIIKDMEDIYIHNIIRCLRGEGNTTIPNPYNGFTNEEWLKIFNNEWQLRVNRTSQTIDSQQLVFDVGV